jgi:hypothetical protein
LFKQYLIILVNKKNENKKKQDKLRKIEKVQDNKEQEKKI